MKLKYGIAIFCIVVLILAGSYFIWNKYQVTKKSQETVQIQNVEQAQDDTNSISEKPEPATNNTSNTDGIEKKYFDLYIKPDEQNFLASVKNGEYNDLIFQKLYKQYEVAIDILNKEAANALDTIDIDYDRADYHTSNCLSYKNSWISICSVECMQYYKLNDIYIADKYAKYLSPAYKEWLMHLGKTYPLASDGGLSVSPDDLRKYIIFLENLSNNNPNFILKNDVDKEIKEYLDLYLLGLDNTPVFERWNGNKMAPESKESYEKFLNENKNSKYYVIIEDFYIKAKQSNFIKDEKFEDWYYNTFNKKYFSDIRKF